MNSPNELTPAATKPSVARMSRKPLLLVALVGLVLVSVLVYSVNGSKRQAREAALEPVDAQPDKPLLKDDAGPGLAIQTPEPAQKPKPADKRDDKHIVVVAPKKDERAEALRREQDQLRRRKLQAEINALSAPLSVAKGEGSTSGQTSHQSADARKQGRPETGNLDRTDLASLAQGDYNPAADRDKEAFFGRASSKTDATWTLPNTRTPGRRYEIKTGTVIPGVMVTGINSDLPGSIIAQVSQNVYDTADGAFLLIPQGAKLYGVYDSRVVYGQSRVLIAWSRLIFPDGSAVTLGAMPGADMAGYAGFHDEVDNHYFRIFGAAVLMSLISGGMSYALDNTTDTTSTTTTTTTTTTSTSSTTLQDEMVAALASQLGQSSAKLLEKNLSIKPTLEIRPGYRFNVVVTKDVAFEAPYAAWR